MNTRVMVPVATCGTPVLPVRSRAAVVRAVARDTSRPRSHSVPFSSDDSHLEVSLCIFKPHEGGITWE